MTGLGPELGPGLGQEPRPGQRTGQRLVLRRRKNQTFIDDIFHCKLQ